MNYTKEENTTWALDTGRQVFLDSYAKISTHDETPDLVYHYTTTSGLLGILQSKELWVTNCLYLNDPLEGTHLHTAFVRQLLLIRLTQEAPRCCG
jgi:hypothetical protein